MNRARTLSALALAVLIWSAGCVSTPTPQVPNSFPSGTTYLLHLPGVSGTTIFDQWWLSALEDAGAAARVDIYDWTEKDRSMVAVLQSYRENHVTAGKIARFIEETRSRNPGIRIILSSESGGTGVAVWTLEALPRDVVVDEVLLISPVISPGYDLTDALRHVTGKMYYSSSPIDVPTNVGDTLLFGTIDGKRTVGAGLVGFQQPRSADPAEYRKLVQLRYNPLWMVWGNFGFHTGGMSAPFARYVLGPMLVRDEQAIAAAAVAAPQVASTTTPKPPARIQHSVALPR
jgi:hypothetical protein